MYKNKNTLENCRANLHFVLLVYTNAVFPKKDTTLSQS